MDNTTVYTASEARKNLYKLIRSAAKGLKTFEIQLRDTDPVVLVNKAEMEAWQETLDVLMSRDEIKNIKQAKKEKKLISHREMLRELKLEK